MNLREELDRAAPVVDRINDAIRESPLAAGLIGAGLAWMVFGAKGFGAFGAVAKGASGAVGSAAGTASLTAANAGKAALKAGSTATATLKDAATGVVDKVGSIVPDLSEVNTETVTNAVSDTGTLVAERFQSLASSGREYGSALQSRLSESLEKQPLLLGAIGLVIGAGIASTFATTQIESELVGDRGAAVRETLKDLASEAKDRAGQVLSEVQEEAGRQGLTIDAAKDAAKTVAGKMANIAGTAKDAVAQPFKSPP